MPDITCCANIKCKRRKKCYRFRAVPDDRWQAFSVFGGGPDCTGFWEIDRGAYLLSEVDADTDRTKTKDILEGE